jgi:hypothetical protein
MPGAVRSAVDASILNAMRARRMCTEQQAEEKLRVLRRLRRRHETNSLPKETSAETSFIEQLFAKLFDYATMRTGTICLRNPMCPKRGMREAVSQTSRLECIRRAKRCTWPAPS